MDDFRIIATFSTRAENSHFPVSKQTLKVQLSLDVLEKIRVSLLENKRLSFRVIAGLAFGSCCKLHTHWQFLVFPTSKTNSYFLTRLVQIVNSPSVLRQKNE